MKQIQWGILGAGNIANALAQAITDSSNGNILGVASRSQERVDHFGDKWNIQYRYNSYEMLVENPDIDVIYIATPHSHHAEQMHLCLNAGKAVLCEKAFTLNAKEAETCIQLARDKQLFLMEAMWTRFLPAIVQLQQWVDEGQIGDIRLIQGDFCVNFPYDANHRIYKRELGGGALLDLGIYPISLTTMLLGLPDKVLSYAHLAPTGVDELNTMNFIYEHGASALLTSSSRINRPVDALIAGTKGYIKIHAPFFRPSTLTLHLDGREPKNFEYPFLSNGYIYEVEEVHRCLEAGLLESSTMSLDESLALMRLMDGLRAQWGVTYPIDEA